MEALVIKRVVREDGKVSCPCGCLGFARGRSALFCMGHDMRLRGALIRAHLADQPVVFETPARCEGTAMGFAETHGWSMFLHEAKLNRDRKCAELAAKAKKNPRLEKLGTTPDWPVVAVYLNATGSRDVEYIDLQGKKHWRHLKPKEAV